MKKRTLWSRLLSLGLAVAMLLGVVSALTYDFSGDGKTNVWDLQMAINQGKTQEEKADALKEALDGKGDELHKNAEGKYEIWSTVGLYNMAKLADKGYRFLLMARSGLRSSIHSQVQPMVDGM